MINIQVNRDNFLWWSIAVLIIVVALVYGVDATRVVYEKWQASRPTPIPETPEPTPLVGVVKDGEFAGMEVDMSDALLIRDIVEGDGEEVQEGDKIRVHYTGTLNDGTVFDSSVKRDQPFEFVLGTGQVIEGWDKGILGMKVGGKRELTIPASMAYGDQALPGIPAGSTLNFEVELLDILAQ